MSDAIQFTDKPVLRIGEYHHACASDPLADSPLRLERNRDGIYYWAMVRSGEYHWWPTIKSTDSTKKEVLGSRRGLAGSGT